MIFPASTGIISGEIRLLIAKLLADSPACNIYQKNHVANLPEKDSNIPSLVKTIIAVFVANVYPVKN